MQRIHPHTTLAVEGQAGDLLREASVTLREAGVDTPEHDAKLLLAEAYGMTLSDVDKALLMGGELPDRASESTESVAVDDLGARRAGETAMREPDALAPATGVAPGHEAMPARQRLFAMVARRAAREPLQYIVGHAPFRYLDLQVGPGVFIPRPETEVVVQAGLDWLLRERIGTPRVVDLCAGSGAIGLSVATEVPGSEVWAVELSPEAAAWAQRNRDALSHRYPQIGASYHLEVTDATSLATLRRLDGSIDLVITNPPYIPQSQIPRQPEVRDHDPQTALYGGSHDGTLTPERIILRAEALLASGGALVMEHDISQADRLAAFAASKGFSEARTGRDFTGRPRYLFAVKA